MSPAMRVTICIGWWGLRRGSTQPLSASSIGWHPKRVFPERSKTITLRSSGFTAMPTRSASIARVVLMGESAGGGHAATLAIAARDRREVPLAGQVLVYPMLDDRTGATRAVAPSIGQIIWRAQDNRDGWTALLGQPAGSATVPNGAVPARVSDLRGLPPTFIGVGSIDLFAEEDIEFARRLVGAEVSTELIVAPGAFHGFHIMVPRAAVSKQFSAALEAALTRLLSDSKD